MRSLLALLRETRGANAIQYGLIAALIAVVAITATKGFGSGNAGRDTAAAAR